MNNMIPFYTKKPIPPLYQLQKSLCNQDVIWQMHQDQERENFNLVSVRLANLNETNMILRLGLCNLLLFRNQTLLIINRPCKIYSFGIYGLIGLLHLFQRNVGLSNLNFLKVEHNFRDTINSKYIYIYHV